MSEYFNGSENYGSRELLIKEKNDIYMYKRIILRIPVALEEIK